MDYKSKAEEIIDEIVEEGLLADGDCAVALVREALIEARKEAVKEGLNEARNFILHATSVPQAVAIIEERLDLKSKHQEKGE